MDTVFHFHKLNMPEASTTDLINKSTKDLDVAVEAKERDDQYSDKIQSSIENALKTIFGERDDNRQFIDIRKIPLLCVQVKEIHAKLGEIVLMLESLKIVRQIVFGAVGLIIVGFFAVLGSLVYK